jgi:hypothetical protein
MEDLLETKPLLELTPEDFDRMAGPANRVFIGISEAWSLDDSQRRALLGAETITCIDHLERVGLIIGIYRDLHTVLPGSADGWVHRPNSNPMFGGQSALELMISGGLEGIRLVREHLGSWAHGQ